MDSYSLNHLNDIAFILHVKKTDSMALKKMFEPLLNSVKLFRFAVRLFLSETLSNVRHRNFRTD